MTNQERVHYEAKGKVETLGARKAFCQAIDYAEDAQADARDDDHSFWLLVAGEIQQVHPEII